MPARRERRTRLKNRILEEIRELEDVSSAYAVRVCCIETEYVRSCLTLRLFIERNRPGWWG